MDGVFISLGFAILSAAFSLIWWEVRQLRKSKHNNAQALQWLMICVGILAQRAGVDLPKIVKGDE